MRRALWFPGHKARREYVGFSRVRGRLIAALERAGFSVVDGGLEPPGEAIQVSHGQPFDTDRYRKFWERRPGVKHAVLMTTYESEKLPKDWAKRASDFDAVWTTSEWAVGVFRREFAEIGLPDFPVYRVGHGVDPGAFPIMRRRPAGAGGRPFLFFWKGLHPADRKRGQAVIDAFQKLGLPNSHLLVKSSPQVSAEHVFKNFQNVTSVAGWWTDDEQRNVLANADCFVSPTRCEGFGMEPLEAVATGLPSITTAYSGILDYLFEFRGAWNQSGLDYLEPYKRNGQSFASACCYPLQNFELTRSFYTLECERVWKNIMEGRRLARSETFEESEWDYGNDAMVPLEDIMAAMEFVYKHHTVIAEVTAECAVDVHKNWNWDRVVVDVVNALTDMGLIEDVIWSETARTKWIPQVHSTYGRKSPYGEGFPGEYISGSEIEVGGLK